MRRRLIVFALLVAVTAFFAAPREHALAADPPTITTVTPSSGTANAFVTVFGTGFQPGAMVIFGGTLSTSVSFVTANHLNVQVPSTISGAIPVQVVNPDAQSASWPGFTYSGTPAGNSGSVSVAGINPGSGVNGQPVHITGGGFDQGATVFFGNVSAGNVVWMTGGYLMAYPPIGSGTVAVKVVNPNGQSATAPTNFTYTGTATGGTSTGSVVITSVSPGNVSAGASVTISGTGFIVGATVSIGGYAATSVQVVASNLITAIAPAGPTGVVSVIVSNPGGQSGVFPGLSYGGTTTTVGSQPTVSSVSPAVGSSAGGTVVSLNGAGFVAPATVTFGGVPATSVTMVSPYLITATTPPGAVGPVGVLVSSPSGAVGGMTSGFTYELAWPRVTGVSPSTGALTGGTTLTITGSGFAPGATVTIAGQPAATVSAVSPTQITVTTPPGPSGNATILVTNPGGAISGLASAFQYSANPQPQAPPPSTVSINSVTPPIGPSGGGTAITIYGTGFVSGATVTISGISVSATVVSSTQITAVTPAVSGTGVVTVTVTNPTASTASLPSAFTYSAGGTSGGTSTGGGTTGGSTNPLPAGGGLFVFAGGTNAQLLTQSGCKASSAVFWTTGSTGAWIGYIPSVPVAVVNAAWMALFPTSIPAGTPIFARC